MGAWGGGGRREGWDREAGRGRLGGVEGWGMGGRGWGWVGGGRAGADGGGAEGGSPALGLSLATEKIWGGKVKRVLRVKRGIGSRCRGLTKPSRAPTRLGRQPVRRQNRSLNLLDERSALGSKVAIACCTSRTRRAIEKLEGPVSPLQWHRNGVCRTRTLHQLRSFRAHGVPKGISNFVTGATMD
ncbi:hypothetical protein TIFTF001_021948 [Ficus carica]|uniref:Uncharacterized protein n=1 Tax=Ficus carica TaxID=3494 RepID=A0AA88AIE9_FICCA|nr:hypothetical protein TIFTF001_021948 [Ficus carica]